MSLQSTVGVAKLGTKSLRATVPEGIVAYLDIRVGEKLEWRMEMMNGERVVIVRKLGSHSEGARIAAKYDKSKRK